MTGSARRARTTRSRSPATDQCEFFGAFRVGRRGRPRDVSAEVVGRGPARRRLARRLSPPARPKPVHHRETALTTHAHCSCGTRWSPAAPRTGRVARALRPGARGVRRSRRSTARIETGGLKLAVRAFGGSLAVEDGALRATLRRARPCAVLALHKGAGRVRLRARAARRCRLDRRRRRDGRRTQRRSTRTSSRGTAA